MTDASQPASDPLRAWLEATSGAPPPGSPAPAAAARTPRPLYAAAAGACLVALCLGAVAAGRAAPASPPAPAAAPLPTAAPTGPLEPLQTGAEGASSDGAAMATAVLAVRTGAGDERYADTAVAEDIIHLGGMRIVTVRVLMLRRSGDRWGDPAVERYGVAVSGDADSVALGPPWPLPPPAGTPRPPDWQPVRDPHLARAAEQALAKAGYADVRRLRIRSDEALPQVVNVVVSAVAPGDVDGRDHELLLAPDASSVLGLAQPPPLPVPLERP